MNDDQLLDELLAHPGYEVLQRELTAEIYQSQADTLEKAQDWDEVMFKRGWCSALSYIGNLRNIRENLSRNDEGDFENG